MYSRCVNTIRKFFYDQEYSQNKDFLFLFKDYNILSTQRKPKYWDGEQFIYILLSIGIINTAYLGYALYSLFGYKFTLWVIIPCVLFFVLHFISYVILTRSGEANKRFYAHSFGIDIDGVLNLHKEQFISIYNQLIEKGKIEASSIAINDITTIPVHDAGKIEEANERKVFQIAEYWSTMNPMKDASRVIKEVLKNKMGYKIHIFTSRDWKPIQQDGSPYNLEKQTKKWLKDNSIPYDKICLEKGNFDRPISRNTALYGNRFYFSLKRKIEFFVEDEPLKARRLANICRYVFLIDHPYNQEESNKPFPYNVIRVSGWNEIETKMRELL